MGDRRATIEARARRSAVRVLTRASRVPVLRAVATPGMRVLFDRLAPSWEQIRRDPAYRDAMRAALDLLPPAFAPRFVLDVACGTGIATSLVLERLSMQAAHLASAGGARAAPDVVVVGTDVSPRMVELARELVPAATFEVAASADLPLLDESVDLVTSLDGVFDIAELRRVVAPRGIVLIVYSMRGTTPVTLPLGALERRFTAAGFDVAQHRGGPGYVLVCHRR